MIWLCELTIVIPWHPCLFRMAKAVSSTVKVVNSVTSDSVNSFNIAMRAFATKCLPIELVPSSDGWRKTWYQTIHTMPGLLVSSIPQCEWNRHAGAGLELLQSIGCFEPIFIEAHQASKMICESRSLKWPIKTHSCLEVIITSNSDVFKDIELDMAAGSRKLGNPTRKTAENDDTIKRTAGP